MVLLLGTAPGAARPTCARQQATRQQAARQRVARADTTRRAGAPPPEFEAPPQSRPLRGVTWLPPTGRAQAVRELRQIKSAGVEAVRTPLLRREALLHAADSLRLRLFQDLPAAYLAAGELSERLPHLRWELERALLVARRHPSARHFGLLSRGDTSVPATCEALRELAARVRHRAGPGETTAYYETSFIEADRCAGTTGLTLLSTLNRERPAALLRRWRQARVNAADITSSDTTRAPSAPSALPDSVSVGIGALGTWVESGTEGLRAPHSPQSQARYFEEHLPPLLGDSVRAQAAGAPLPAPAAARRDSFGGAPAVVFAYRWRDAQSDAQSNAQSDATRTTQEDPYGRTYGLRATDGAARPALKVVRGLYTGRQAVFAFDAGSAPPSRPPWLVLVGWGLVALLGVAYASTSRFRGLVQRYFGSTRFYRDAVREERAALGAGSFVLLGGMSLCAGLVATVFLQAVQETGPFLQMLRGASAQTQGWMLTLLARPWLAVLIVAVFYLVSLTVWAVLLSLATRRAQPLSTMQTLALVVWPRWPAFLLGAAAVVAATLPPGWALAVSGGVLGVWGLVSVAAVLRTLYDLVQMAGISSFVAPALVLLNPMLLAAVLAFFAVLEMLPEAHFLWHLATRS